MSRALTTAGVASRTRWFVLALLPLLALRSAQLPAFAGLLALSLLLALVFAALAAFIGRQPLRLAWLDEANWATALLLPLWFGSALVPGALALALLFAMASRLPVGGMGQQLFHPATVGCAVLLLFGMAPAPAAAASSPLLEVLAIVFAAALLAWRLRRDLRAPAALLLAFGSVALLAQLAGAQASPGGTAWTRLALAACLVSNDAVTAPSRAAARIVFGAGAGLAAALLPGDVEALPFALLALQAVAPWLDRSAGPRATAAGSHASGARR